MVGVATSAAPVLLLPGGGAAVALTLVVAPVVVVATVAGVVGVSDVGVLMSVGATVVGEGGGGARRGGVGLNSEATEDSLNWTEGEESEKRRKVKDNIKERSLKTTSKRGP